MGILATSMNVIRENAFTGLCSLSGGILAGRLTGHLWPAVLTASIVLIAYLLSLCHKDEFPYIKPALYPAMMFTAGWTAIFLSLPTFSSPVDFSEGRDKQRVSGIVEESITGERGERSVIDVMYIDSIECRNVRMLLFSGSNVLYPGDIVRFRGNIREIHSGLADSPILKGYVSGPGDVEIIAFHHSLITEGRKIRNLLSSGIDDIGLSDNAKGFVKGIILGEKSGISRKERRKYSDTGLSHILAVSGMHIAIIASIMMFLTGPLLLVKGGDKLRYVLILLAVWLFALISGFSYSSVRASVMITFGLSAYIIGRPRAGFPAVCLATVFILLFSPFALFDPGMQLSFLCVAAIMLFAEPLNPIGAQRNVILHKLSGAIIVTLVTTAVIWPVISYYFGVIPVHFLICNLLVLPLLPIYVMMTVGILTVHSIGPDMSHTAFLLESFPNFIELLFSHLYGDAIYYRVSAVSVIIWMTGICTLPYSLGLINTASRKPLYSPRRLEIRPLPLIISFMILTTSLFFI